MPERLTSLRNLRGPVARALLRRGVHMRPKRHKRKSKNQGILKKYGKPAARPVKPASPSVSSHLHGTFGLVERSFLS
ncbi:hypothetical protein GOB82_08120 [Acetobacter farinalis]|nr:hypothetical protein [Acetobacter farinalis]